MCKVKKEENLFWWDSQLPSQISRTRVRLLYYDDFGYQIEKYWDNLALK